MNVSQQLSQYNQKLNAFQQFIVGQLKNYPRLMIGEQVSYPAILVGLLLMVIAMILYIL